MEGAIVDLDGTVYRSGELIPGANEGVEQLRAAGLDILFFSNNPTRDGTAYADRLTDLGIPAAPEEACSAGVATTEYLLDHHADDSILCIGADGLVEQFRAADLTLTEDPTEADVLVASWTEEFDYSDMETALAASADEIAFLGTDPDRTFPGKDGAQTPGSGAIIGAVASVVGREPDAILGKPSETATAIALDRLGVDPESCLVVGDRLDTDLLLGANVGMTTVLVETGIAGVGDIQESAVEPDFVIDSLGDIGQVLESCESLGR